ncbi:hypothetical protein BCV70DRAFT_199784 [Testicularia cyperi]|uniref:Uncharacterized protein n=1 Tax=Testicularia cyperi TaxID=1882483 RepID=A0A317XQB7_9BASI|nr:hypothetical protein BCV70DRAFT_199784 [Testicularia cyperi]
MKAAFRLRRKASNIKDAVDPSFESDRRHADTRHYSKASPVPRLPEVSLATSSGRTSPMPGFRFSGLGLDHLMSRHEVDSSRTPSPRWIDDAYNEDVDVESDGEGGRIPNRTPWMSRDAHFSKQNTDPPTTNSASRGASFLAAAAAAAPFDSHTRAASMPLAAAAAPQLQSASPAPASARILQSAPIGLDRLDSAADSAYFDFSTQPSINSKEVTASTNTSSTSAVANTNRNSPPSHQKAEPNETSPTSGTKSRREQLQLQASDGTTAGESCSTHEWPHKERRTSSDDRHSIEAVRNDVNNRRLDELAAKQIKPDSPVSIGSNGRGSATGGAAAPSKRRTEEPSDTFLAAPTPARSIRRSISQPEFDRTKVIDSSDSIMQAGVASRAPTASKPPGKASVSTILESARKANKSRIAQSPSTSSSVSAINGPPTAPSLFAYEGTVAPLSSSRSAKKVNDSSASIVSTKTKKSLKPTIDAGRATIRNARGEIEWKDAPQPPSPAKAAPSSGAALQRPSDRQRTRSSGSRPDRADRKANRSPGRDWHDASSKIPFRAIGTASQEPGPHPPQRPRPRRRSTDGDGYHTADDEDIEAREWERKRALQMEQDRLEIHRKQQARDEEKARALRRAERERQAAEAAERERLAEERRKAEREARRIAREKAEKEEAERRQREREEAEARRRRDRELAEERRIQAEKEAEERRVQEEKEAEERRIRKQKEAEERRIQRQKEAEECKIRQAKEAEERRIREEEEAKRREEEEIARKEAERLAAIEAERLAKEAAIRAEQEAVVEKERQLAEAKRQVEEEDKAARRAGRRDDRRAQRALAAGLPAGEMDPDAQQSEDEELSDAESAVFVDADDSTEADTRTGAMIRSTSNLEAPSSTDGSSDMPVTPADEKIMTIGSLQPAEMTKGASSSSAGDGHVKFESDGVGSGEQTPTPTAAMSAEKTVPYKPDRFRFAVKSGARRTATLWTPHAVPESEQASPVSEDDQIVQPNGPYREGGITYGKGWCAHGLADPSLVVDHRRYVRVARPPRASQSTSDDDLAKESETAVNDAVGENPEPETEAAEFDEIMYSDLGELIWSATTPDVIARLVSHLDYADIKALRQTSLSIRFALGQLGGREIVLSRFLAPVGYRSWKPCKLLPAPDAPIVDKDPMPLSFSDCEAFLLSFDLLPEYHLVGAEYARAPHKMDPRYPRLARATTRAYNRVLTRLRMQPDFRIPPNAMRQGSLPPSSPASPAPQTQMLSPVLGNDSRFSNRSPSPGSGAGPFIDESRLAPMSAPLITSPWKPGRAGFFRAWVPSTERGGWLSDTELARCERELFIAGVWPHLRKGDVVWDCAVGDERNEGKYVFDGRYLRDLSFMFDRGGHLPSWLNAFAFPPSYYHNIIRSSDQAQPVVYLDVLPWRDQIVSTMRLVQDQVETFSPQGARYRISKWLYRAIISIVPGQIISDEGLEVVDAGWHGRIVIETEGTAEHAKELISRCAGPAESAQTKARLLASVMDADGRPANLKAPAPTRDAKGNRIETTTPWAIVRARSRPGLIWLRPLDMRERVVF